LFRENDWEICGEAENGREAIEKAQQLKPDVIVLDLSMPVMNGITAARILQKIMPRVHLVLFTLYSNLLTPEEVASAGISAVVPKNQAILLLREVQRLTASVA
jgi:DNA-binding NarL/FixJ family response regulator